MNLREIEKRIGGNRSSGIKSVVTGSGAIRKLPNELKKLRAIKIFLINEERYNKTLK